MNHAEYLALAAVEDRMWYFRALHAHARDFVNAGLAGMAGVGRSGVDVLDAGCGTGGWMRRMKCVESGWRVTGVDVSSQACALARERTVGVEVREAAVTALPFAERCFDAVVSLDVLYAVEDECAALREFYRCLRPGGVLVVNVPAYAWLWSYHDEAVHGRRRYARGGVVRLMAEAGFAAVRSTYWNTLPFPLIVARRKLFPAKRGGGGDVALFPRPVEAVFRGMMGLERAWLRMTPLPFGCSVLAMGRKPLANAADRGM